MVSMKCSSGPCPLFLPGRCGPVGPPIMTEDKTWRTPCGSSRVCCPNTERWFTLHGDIFEAWSVYKSDTVALDAFTARRGAPSGRVNGQRIELGWQPTRWNRLGRLPQALPSSIPILTLGAGDDAALLKLVDERAERSIDGLVVASLGAGSIPPTALGQLRRLAHMGLPVVCCSGAPSGPAAATAYYPGMYTELIEAGLMIEDFLSPRKARIRLMLSLGLGLPYRPFAPQ